MFTINLTKLNESEKKIMETLLAYAKNQPYPNITKAAEICGCSVSQISKSIKKAGFNGYKQFISYLYHGEQPNRPIADEIERLKRVLADFELNLVYEFAELIVKHDNIVLFGYGPSAICAQYFEYKLRLCSNALVITAPDEQSAMSMMNRATLLVIFTTTGQYRSFAKLTLEAKYKGAEVAVVSEEFNPLLMENCDHYFVLTQHRQPATLKPYEKTRTVFFIFLEQVIQTLLEQHNKPSTQ
ncbi:MAG: SIS domain-containing protein [Treponema sp.]|nr:SIS domain-containing protein [Treponema sp.]